MIRIVIELALCIGAYLAGILTHKWAVKNAKDIADQATDAINKL